MSGLRKYIRDRDQDLKIYPQNDGPAFGSEGDLVMKAQDYMHVWEDLPYAVVLAKKINGYNAALDLAVASFHTMHFDLSLADGTWKIDSLYHVWNTRPLRLNFH